MALRIYDSKLCLVFNIEKLRIYLYLYHRLHPTMTLHGSSVLAHEWEVVVVRPHCQDRIPCPWKNLITLLHQEEEEYLVLEVVHPSPLEIGEEAWDLQGNLCQLIHH